MSADNEMERRRWNDERWTSTWPRREQLTSSVTATLLERAGLGPGQRVLEIGSGGGTATLPAGAAVGPDGSVTGADVSVALVELARRRASQAGAANVRFVVADAQSDRVEGGPFDAATSQFGVMFFDEPVKAFANIRAHLRPGAPLTFACWQAVEHNPWFLGPSLATFVEPPPPPVPGKSPTGPFTLADPDRTVGLLAAAGWNDVTRSVHETVVTVAADIVVVEEQLSFLGVPPERLDDARAAVEAHLAPLQRGDGTMDAPLAYQVFSATA